MSQNHIEQVKCPVCHYDSPMTMWNYIDGVSKPECLLEECLPEYIVDAFLSGLRKRESYMDFVARAKQNPIGRMVKIHDHEDNLNVLRLDEVSPSMA